MEPQLMVNLLEKEVTPVVGVLLVAGNLFGRRKANEDIFGILLLLAVELINICPGPLDGVLTVELFAESLIGTELFDNFCGALAINEERFNDVKGLGVF
jgi:hypothetical protein